MARYIAKNLVAAGLCEKCQVTLAYAIGKAEPRLHRLPRRCRPLKTLSRGLCKAYTPQLKKAVILLLPRRWLKQLNDDFGRSGK